jgi:preprotein translocase subunit YajC
VRGVRAAKLRQLVFPSRLVPQPALPVRYLRCTRPLRHQLEGSPAMVTMILAAAATAHKSNPAFTFIILAVLIGLFYMLIMRPQRNRQRKASQTQSAVMPGQRIRTTAGMYGTVISGDDRDVVIEIAPGVQVTMLRRAVMDVVSDDAVPSDEDMPSHEDIVSDEAEYADPEGRINWESLMDQQRFYMDRGYTNYTQPIDLTRLNDDGPRQAALQSLSR